MQPRVKKENSENCGYVPPVEPRYRWVTMDINKYWICGDCDDTPDEMQKIEYLVMNKKFDFILTHTCPISWEPTDLFLGCIDQTTVDKSMELFLENVRLWTRWKIWCFGHYHADRVERPGVEQFYYDYEWLDTIWNRWEGEKTFENEWWLSKSPNYYMT